MQLTLPILVLVNLTFKCYLIYVMFVVYVQEAVQKNIPHLK